MAKIAIYLLSALLLVSSAVAAQWDSIHPFKYQGVKTCYWVAQDPATRCLLTAPKKENGVIVDAHVYTHCRSTCENHLPAGVTQDPAATDSEMKFPLLGLTGKNNNVKTKTVYYFKTCSYIFNKAGVSNGHLLFPFVANYLTYFTYDNLCFVLNRWLTVINVTEMELEQCVLKLVLLNVHRFPF